MTLTLLLDLDDTLITNRADSFVIAYLHALGKHLMSRFNPDHLVKQLMRATQLMVQNEQPNRSLEEVFDQAFYPSLNVQRADLQEAIDRFYSEVFPSLEPLTTRRPEAVRLVETALQRGYHIAVATNPLFPRTAVYQRLAWAGLPPDRYPFQVISTYETFHFAKPNPAYFAEVLAQMGWPDGPVVMVGNDPENDAYPAAKAGIHTYLLMEEDGQVGRSFEPPHGTGKLAGLLEWLSNFETAGVRPDYSSPDALVAVLKSTPAALGVIGKQLPSQEWSIRTQPDEWSLGEICCHLRDVELEVNLPRLIRVFQEENPFIPGMETDQWAEERGYIRQDGPTALQEFLQARIRLLAILKDAKPADWQRVARHAIFGRTDLRELVGITATHDRSHVRQFYHVNQLVR